MMLKAQKIEFVKKLKEEIRRYRVVGIMPISAVPDRLLQRVRNTSKDMRIVIARKNLILKALEGDKNLEGLRPYVDRNVALILTNKDPFELHRIVSANRLKLGAKPGQIAPQDIQIESGETAIPPGQAVTDLKTAGIDVQIQKGKVVIAKTKVLVQKGAKISNAVAKALKMLEITPFEVSTTINALVSNNLLFTGDVLGITPELVRSQISTGFSAANSLSTNIGYVTKYNVGSFIKRAYLGALGIGLATRSYEPGIIEKLIAEAVLEAVSLSSTAKG